MLEATTLFLNGGALLARLKRPFIQRSTPILLLLLSLFLVGCGSRISNANWPGMTSDGSRIYVAYGPGVLAYDVEAKQTLWTYPPEARAGLSFYAAPSVADDHVVFGDYGVAGGMLSPTIRVSIYAVDGDGNPIWAENNMDATASIVAPPLQVGGQLFVGTSDNKLLALDATTGKQMWAFETGHSIWGQPTYKDGTLFIASLDKSTYALDATTGSVKWESKLSGALPSQVVTDSELIYVSSFDRQVHALAMDTGAEQWSATAADWVWGAPTLAGDKLFYGDIKGNLYAVAADSGQPIWQKTAVGAIQTNMLVVDDVVYVVSGGDIETGQGSLAAYDANSGDQLWQKNTSGPLYTAPVIINDTLIVAVTGNAAELLIGFDFDGNQLWTVPQPGQS